MLTGQKKKATINTKTGTEEKNLIRRAHKNGGAPWLLSWKKQRPGLSVRLLLSNKARKESS